MVRAKWVRLVVRDLGDALRWAHGETAHIERLRYRVVHGREIVSFRLVPGYAIEVGARDIVVVAFARRSPRTLAAAWLRAAVRRVFPDRAGPVRVEAAIPARVIPLPTPKARRPAAS